MWFVAGWRAGADVAVHARVVFQGNGTGGQFVGGSPRVFWQAVAISRDVVHRPMPETAAGRRVRVVHGQYQRFCRFRYALPLQCWADVFTAATEAVSDLRMG